MVLASLKIHDHACHVYDNHQDHLALIGRFLKIGLMRREKCVCVSDIFGQETFNAFIKGIEDHGTMVKNAASSGALVMRGIEAPSPPDCFADPESMILFLETQLQSALAEGYSGLRYMGEMAWKLNGRSSNETGKYEVMLDAFLHNHEAVGLCNYNRGRISPEIIKEAVYTHPFIMLNNRFYKNRHYLPPGENSPVGKAALETDLLLRSICRAGKTEKILRDSDERFTAFLEIAPEAVIIHNGDTIEYVNRAGLAMFGAESAARMVGMYLAGFFPSDIRLKATGQSKIVQKNGKTVHSVIQKLQHLDGTSFYAEVTGGEFMYNARKAHFYLIRDVDRRERAEALLHHSEIKYRELVESANSIIIRFDASFNITFLNKFGRDFFGFAQRELAGKKLLDVIAPTAETSGRYVKSIIVDIFRNPQKYRTHESEVIRRDGSRVWIAWTNKPVFDETGRFREVLSIGNDITERKAAEEALLASREELKAMGAELSIAEERERQRIATEFHDLVGQNLALAKIKLNSLPDLPSSAKTADSISEVRDLIGETIKELRSQIFRISPPILHMVGFEAAVESLCDKYQDDCGINVVFHDDGNHKPIGEDLRGTLYTMVRELLLNVAKHAKAVNVVVSVEKVEDAIEIRVEDDGIGFHPAEVCLPGDKKSCLGLFSIRQRIEYLGGSLAMDSAPGRGSRITLLVPIHH
jgi:PAS domain S-box-containing protein